MTNNEHNESILEAISKKMSEIEELKTQLKPSDDVPYADLATCNANAVEARMAKFGQQEAVKKAMASAVASAMAQSEGKIKKAVKNESAKDKAD